MSTNCKYTRRRFVTLAGGVVAAIACAGCLGSTTAETLDSSTADGTAAEAASSSAAGGTSPSSSTNIKTSCPKGLVNDPYPGQCHSYVDSNGSGYCDFSEPSS